MKRSNTSLSLLDNTTLPLVLLGGTLCNTRLWQPAIDHMNVSAVICVTLTGADSAEAQSKRLLAMLPEHFCLVGFSLGAIVALQMLADAPQRLAGLALISANPFTALPESAAPRRAAVANAARQGLVPWLTATLWPHYVSPERLDDANLHDTVVQMALECGLATFAQQTEIAITRHDHRASLANFSHPILILNGDQDVICTAQHHRAIATAAPAAHWQTLPNCGHFLPLEAPEFTAAALRHWLMELL